MNTFGLSTNDLSAINKVFSNYKNIEKVLIYGSRAKGNYKPFSDIDITLLGNTIDLTLQHQIENDLDALLLPYKFDITIFKKLNNPEFIDHINRVGIPFYEKITNHKNSN